MHVFRLGSKSVNYANRIIMQNESHENYPPISYQMMRNMSLSSISDVDTISSDGIDEIIRHRQFSISSLPEQVVNYRQMYSRSEAEQRYLRLILFTLVLMTIHSYFFYLRLDDVSSGYSSPGSPSYVRKSSATTPGKIEVIFFIYISYIESVKNYKFIE
jgi:hypothetical protein